MLVLEVGMLAHKDTNLFAAYLARKQNVMAAQPAVLPTFADTAAATTKQLCH